MALKLNPEQSEIVERAIRAGVIRDAEDVIEAGGRGYSTAAGDDDLTRESVEP